jgi:class 3 adenylate cyclase
MTKPTTSTVVLAVADVAGFTLACRGRSDTEAFEMLNRFYHHAAVAVAPAQGRVVKFIGDAVLIIFPESFAAQAVTAIHDLRDTVQDLWSEFGAECSVRVHAHLGSVACGLLGPDQHFDVIGTAVNDLFRMPSDGPEISPALARKLAAQP